MKYSVGSNNLLLSYYLSHFTFIFLFFFDSFLQEDSTDHASADSPKSVHENTFTYTVLQICGVLKFLQ